MLRALTTVLVLLLAAEQTTLLDGNRSSVIHPALVRSLRAIAGLLPTGESFVEGGIYLPSSSFQKLLGIWLYIYDEHGHVDAVVLPYNFAMSEGDRWSVEPAEP